MSNFDPDLHRSLQEYRDKMECPMEDLAVAIWGFGNDGPALSDDQIVEFAARKITMLKEMLIASGFKKEMLKAVMVG